MLPIRIWADMGSDGNEGVLHIPKALRLELPPSDSLYPVHSLGDGPVGWGCRTYQLHPSRRVRYLYNKCPGYDTNQSDGEVPVMLELWWMRSIPLLPSLQGPLLPGVVAPDRVLSMGQIELICVLILNWIDRNRTGYMNKNRLNNLQ